MKVNCPHCAASYAIDDRRIPASGINVKCPKCQASFPVKRDAEPPAAASGAVPLPAPASPFAAPPPAGNPFAAPPAASEPFSFGAQPGAVPLPAPASPFAAPPPAARPIAVPPAASEPFSFGAQPGAVPLPAPASPFAAPPPTAFAPPPADNPFAAPPADAFAPPPAADNPFAAPPPAPAADPFSFGPAQPAVTETIDFDDGPASVPPDLSFGTELPDAFAPPAPPAAAAGPVAFGEIDFETTTPTPAPVPPPTALPEPDVFAPPPVAAAPEGGEDLEDLFGESKKKSPPLLSGPPSVGEPVGPLSMDGSFKVRRRSGKLFGPYPAEAIGEMLQKGELQGNEDVSSDGGETWQPMSAVPAFRDATGKANAPPPPTAPAPGVPYGSRMAPAKIGEGGEIVRSRPAWLKFAILGAAVVVIAGVGIGGAFTRYGVFFHRAFRSDAERNRIAGIIGKARTGLARGDFAGERDALKAAEEALLAAPDEADAQMVFVIAAGAVERRHAATPDMVARAGRAASDLSASHKGSAQALAAELATALQAGDPQALSAREAALDPVVAKGKADPEVVALLARSALARRDGARSGAQFKKLEALQPGTGRVALGAGLALLAQGNRGEALAAFEKAAAADPAFADARIEGAELAASAGDAEKAVLLLAPLLAPAAQANLAPLDRARVLAANGSLFTRRAADGPAAEKLLVEAVTADARCLPARIALATHRLRRGDPLGAVEATAPVADAAAKNPDLADIRIRAFVAAGRALDAAQLVEAALAASPGNPRLLVAKGMVQEQTGKIAEAQATYRDCIARAPAEGEPRVALARLAMASRDLAAAQVEVTAAVEKAGGTPAPHAALGELRALQGDAAGAEAAFKKALVLDEEHAPALVGLARIALARGDTVGARAGVDRALLVDPSRVDARRLRGELLWKAGDLPGAEADFKAATDLQPRDAVGFARLGAVMLERGDVVGATRALENAATLDAKLVEAQFWLGRALYAKGELPGALSNLKKAIELDPKNPLHHLWLGITLEKSNSLGEAVEAYRAAAAADPKLAEANERVGNIYATAGRCDEAVPAYQKALEAKPGTASVRISIADCRAKLGKHDDAIRIYRDVLKGDPKAVTVPYKLARSIHESAGVRDAVPWYERAVREETGNPMPYYFLGFAYKDRGQRAKAVQFFKQYLAKRPDAEDRKDIEREIEDLGG